jgi:hypothetical protein
MSTNRLEVETRIHVLEHIRRARDLYREDLKQLFDHYKDDVRPKEDETLEPIGYGDIEFRDEGIRIN